MNTKTDKRHLSAPMAYAALILLTGITWLVSESGASSGAKIAIVIMTMIAKFSLISLVFMELQKAHVLWRLMASVYILALGAFIAGAIVW